VSFDPARAAALQAAVEFHASVGDLDLRCGVDAGQTIGAGQISVLDTAERFLTWLRGPAHMTLIAGPITNQTTGLPTGTTPEGDTVQLHDDEQFDLSVDTKDAKGFETQDVIDWSVDDESVATLTVSDDGRSATVVAGNPGSAVVTVSDGVLSATEAVDVVAAGTATITLVEGAVSKQA